MWAKFISTIVAMLSIPLGLRLVRALFSETNLKSCIIHCIRHRKITVGNILIEQLCFGIICVS